MTTQIATKTTLSVQETAQLIEAGKRLLIAGDESLLRALPRGNWVGGTSPYRMGDRGGECTRDALQVTVLPEFVQISDIRFYEVEAMEKIPTDYPDNGFTYIVIPAFTLAHRRFAEECSGWTGIFDRPLMGWIAGVDLNDLDRVTPKVFDGRTLEESETAAVVMHVDLPQNLYAHVNIVNVFRQGPGDAITFPAAGFEQEACMVKGEKRSFAAYIVEKGIDMRLPLVADYCGAMINVSVRAVDAAAGKVELYAPAFPNVEYKFAAPSGEYDVEFRKFLGARKSEPVFSCNCILNYLYANLEGKSTGELKGPITFGEIAYMLLNQTLVYLTFEEK